MIPDSRVFRLLSWFANQGYVYNKILGDSNIGQIYGYGAKTLPVGLGIYIPCILKCDEEKRGNHSCVNICVRRSVN